MIIQKARIYAVIFAMGLMMAGCGTKMPPASPGGAGAEPVPVDAGTAESEAEKNAAGAETRERDAGKISQEQEAGSRTEVVNDNMKPVYGKDIKDGVYPVTVDSSSSMFRITSCDLTVKDGMMRAVMTMGGTGYLKVYMGTGEEALRAREEDYIPFVETEEGTHTFEVPVEALDMGIDCSAFSKNKEKWYDRILVFRADSLPADAFADGRITAAESLELEDGRYTAEVVLEGGSGRASVESPAALRVTDGNVFATIVWSSANYDYMKVDNEKFEAVSMDGNSVFEIPVMGFDWRMPVIADTIAMSEPHEIDYTLTFDSSTLKRDE